MAMEAQRIRTRAQEIRDERAARTTRPYDAERDGPEGDDEGTLEPNPDEAATVRTPVETPRDRVARTEGVSTMRTLADQEGLDAETPPELREQSGIRRLGYELGQQVDERVQSWLEPIREEFAEAVDTGPDKAPRGFIFGSMYGAALTLFGFAAALVVTKIGSRRD